MPELPNEERFQVRPVGVRYKCELCGKGYMEVTNEPVIVPAVMMDPPQPIMRNHRCNVCGGTMKLPGAYPRIDWEPVLPRDVYIQNGTQLTEEMLLRKAAEVVIGQRFVNPETITDELPVDTTTAKAILKKLEEIGLVYDKGSGVLFAVAKQSQQLVINLTNIGLPFHIIEKLKKEDSDEAQSI